MHNTVIILTGIIVVLAVCFDFINGFHDTANAIASSVTTRALTPGKAVLMSASLNFIGALLRTEVAKTIGSGIVEPKSVIPQVILAALIGAIIWNLFTWYFGIPSSSSHALIGGLIGSALVYKMMELSSKGQFSMKTVFSIVNWANFFDKVILWLILSPIIGFGVGFIVMTALQWLAKDARPRTITQVFSKCQIASAAAVALNHGMNDAQKSMGIITMALVSAGLVTTNNVPMWVKVTCALAMAVGTSVGGWKIIKTMGQNIGKLTPINGFAVDTSAAAVIFTASMMQAPVSTTHIVTTAIMGVNASKRLSAVRWTVAKNIVWAWVITIPISAALSGVAIFLITKLA